jgi:hypothetical protein
MWESKMTSLVPEPDAVGDLHFVLCDFGRLGKAFVETARADRETVVEDILSGELSEPLRVIALLGDGTWHDVSAEVGLDVVKRATVAGEILSPRAPAISWTSISAEQSSRSSPEPRVHWAPPSRGRGFSLKEGCGDVAQVGIIARSQEALKVAGRVMSDGKDDLLRQADVCFRRSLSADRFSAPFWLALSQQWVRMAAEVDPPAPGPGMSSPPISSSDLEWLNDPLGESLPERALAVTAARTRGS